MILIGDFIKPPLIMMSKSLIIVIMASLIVVLKIFMLTRL